MTPEELKKLVGDAKPNTLKEWLVGWGNWTSYRQAMGRSVSITPGGQRELATLIMLDNFLGPECQDKDCLDYDGEHPYHSNIGARMHEAGQNRLRADYEKTKQDLSDANDRIRELLESMKKLDQLEKLSHEIRDQDSPRIGLGDGERASLEHARIIFEALHGVRTEGTVTGRLSSAHPNPSNAPKSAPAERQPSKQSNFGDPPRVFFLNETHELPRLSKKQLRRDRDAKRLEKERDAIAQKLANSRMNQTVKVSKRAQNKMTEDIRKLNKRIKNLRTPKTISIDIETTVTDPVAWVAKK